MPKSLRQNAVVYIQNQKKHHASQSFEEEFVIFFKKYKMPYQEEYLWDYTQVNWKIGF